MVTKTNDDIQPDRATSRIMENNRPRPDGSLDLGIMTLEIAFHLFLIKLTSIDIIAWLQSGLPAWLLQFK